jgi:hypothetical protein
MILKNGQTGFLKAMNYEYAFRALKPGVPSTVFLQELTQNYNYEKDLLEFCKEKGMSRIVTAIAHGEYIDSAEMHPVPYLVFETADGSLKNINSQQQQDLAWKLGVIHGFPCCLSQLHQQK